MDTRDLVNRFRHQVHLPVNVNDVVACLREHGIDDDIAFIGVDLDPEILQGQIKIFHVRAQLYGDEKRHANIYYHRGHSLDWQRLICCKELIHLLDPVAAHTNLADEIDRLAERIGLPPEMQEPPRDGVAVNTDRLAEYRAVAILLPWEARQVLMPLYQAGKITLDDVARLADIPRRYAAFVMNEVWETFHELIG